MSPRTRRATLLLSICLVLALSAGCLGTGGDGLPEREEVAEELRSVDAIEGTATLDMDVGNDSMGLRMDLVERTGSAEFRATMHQRSPNATVEMVSNGSTVWVYNRTAGTVRTLRMAGLTSANWSRSVRSISGIFATMGESSEDGDVSVSPLPVVPGGGGAAGAVGATSMPSMGNVSVSYRGTETVVGRETYAVDLVPAENSSLLENGTIWFDAERYYPVKQKFNMSVGGRNVSATVAYHNVTYNPEISEDAFTFEPPENATVTNASLSVSTYADSDALRAAASQSLPEPDLPEDYAFAQGTITASDGARALTLQYANESHTLVVTKQTPPGQVAAEGDSVDVAGHEGTYLEVQTTAALTWKCEGVRYQVTGDYPASTLDAFAESMACE